MDPVLIAVMGATGSGKTTFVNTLSKSSMQTSEGLKSCTAQIQETPQFQLDGRNVVLIDTPGFDDTTKTDTEILTMIADFLAAYYRSGRKLSGILFLHRISDVRMGGISTKNFRLFKRLCGESTLQNVIIVTNMWGNVDLKVGESREIELASDHLFFKPALDKGARMMRHSNTEESAKDIVSQLLDGQQIVCQIQREIVDEGKGVLQTAAADELDKQLKEAMEKQRQELELARAKAEAELALRQKQLEEEARAQRELEAKKAQEAIAKAEAERLRMEAELTRQRLENERRLREEEEARRREAERVRIERENQLEEIRRRQQEEEWRQNQERERIQREIAAARRRRRNSGGGCFIQ